MTAMQPPAQSLEQRMQALDRANEIRAKRAQLKREMKAGRRTLTDVIIDPPDYCESMKLWDLIVSAPAHGPRKAADVLRVARVANGKTLGGLTERQRREVVSALTNRYVNNNRISELQRLALAALDGAERPLWASQVATFTAPYDNSAVARALFALVRRGLAETHGIQSPWRYSITDAGRNVLSNQAQEA